MGFWNKLGRIALKAAPIAASFIPGVGPLAAAAIGGLSSGASRKIEGGSWKDALISGGIGAGTSYGLDKMTAARGIGTNKAGDFAKGAVSGVEKAAQSGGKGAFSKFFGSTGGKLLTGAGAGLGAYGIGKAIANGNDDDYENYDYTRGNAPTYGGDRFARQMRRQLGPVMGQSDQNFPNLAESIGSGRMDAMRDQPFRGGYDVRNISGYDEDKNPEYEYTQMPRIGPNYRQRQQEYTGPQTEPTPRRGRRQY